MYSPSARLSFTRCFERLKKLMLERLALQSGHTATRLQASSPLRRSLNTWSSRNHARTEFLVAHIYTCDVCKMLRKTPVPWLTTNFGSSESYTALKNFKLCKICAINNTHLRGVSWWLTMQIIRMVRYHTPIENITFLATLRTWFHTSYKGLGFRVLTPSIFDAELLGFVYLRGGSGGLVRLPRPTD